MTTTETPKRRTAVPHHRGVDLRVPRLAGSPDPFDLEQVREWLDGAAGPTAIDLFCGAGGLSLGLRDAGFTVLLGADHDARAVETHEGNLGGLGYVGDLSDPGELLDHLDAWGIATVDLVAGGPPCQPFSRAGRSMIRTSSRAAHAAPTIRVRRSGVGSWGSSSGCAPRGARREHSRSAELG